MKWHPSQMHWPHAHAMHMHPASWVQAHPLAILAILLGILALGLLTMTLLSNPSIRPEKLDLKYPAAYPYGPVY